MATDTPAMKSWRCAALAAALLLAAAPAPALDPALQQAVARGGQLFQHETFGGGGRVCETCHLGGGLRPGQRPDGAPMPSLANAAAVFPRVGPDGHSLITLSDQVRACVGGAVKGKAPAYGSEDLNALVAYVSSLSQGKVLDMGGEPK